MKKSFFLFVCLVATSLMCSHTFAAAPRGFIGDTGSGWNTVSAVTAIACSGKTSPNRLPINTINGSGISADGLTHTTGDNSLLWFSRNDANQAPWVDSHKHFIKFSFDQIYPLREMWVWNFNSYSTWTVYGMKQVRVLASATDDQAGWTYANSHPVFEGVISKANGSTTNPVNLVVNFGGIQARYVLITSAIGTENNWSNGAYPETGLGEVRFYPIPANCADAKAKGLGLTADLNGDCRITFSDFAILAHNWMQCMEPHDTSCL